MTAFGQIVLPDRVTVDGDPFVVGAPDFGVAVVELADGPVVRLTTSFYVMQHSKQRGIEFHGDDGSLFLSSWQEFDAPVELARNGSGYEPVPLNGAFRGTDWGRAVAELERAIAEERPHRATGAHAAHVVEIIDAIETSADEGRPVEVQSQFLRPTAPRPVDSRPSRNGKRAGQGGRR